MNEAVITSASYVDCAGYRSSSAGKRLWKETQGRSRKGDISTIAWSSVFSSSCPKFGRMDPLSRAGLMATELLDIDFGSMEKEEKTRIGVCMETCFGSLSVDVDYLKTASPSIFVYTLPSSTIGEICIRHRLMGPVLCLISTGNAGRNVAEEAASWITRNEADASICLFCDAITPQTAGIMKSLLGNEEEASWRVAALYFEQKEKAVKHGKKILEWKPEETDAIFEICDQLCV